MAISSGGKVLVFEPIAGVAQQDAQVIRGFDNAVCRYSSQSLGRGQPISMSDRTFDGADLEGTVQSEDLAGEDFVELSAQS